MTLYPEVQAKAQAEIDMVVGDKRQATLYELPPCNTSLTRHSLPTLEDRPNLPYVDALVKEVLRWQPVVPLG
jgi:cytochrome P450